MHNGPIEPGMKFKRIYKEEYRKELDYGIATIEKIGTNKYMASHLGLHISYKEMLFYKNGKKKLIDNGWNEKNFRENFMPYTAEAQESKPATPSITEEIPKPKIVGNYDNKKEQSPAYKTWAAQQHGLNLKIIPSEYKKPEYKRNPIYPCDNYLDPEWIPNTDLYGKRNT